MNMSGMGYNCSRGETFDIVALNVYGDSKVAAEILMANPEHCEKMVFDGGEWLYLPEIETPATDENGQIEADNAPWKVG